MKKLLVFLNKVDCVDDEEMLELVQMEVEEILEQYGYDPSECPIVAGSALCTLNNEDPEVCTCKVTCIV